MAFHPDFITLSEMARVLNYEFGLEPKIATTTPYDWWKRNKVGAIKLKMPKPYRVSGNSVLFRRNDVIQWYAHWKGLRPLYVQSIVEDDVRGKVEEVLEALTGEGTRKRRRRG